MLASPESFPSIAPSEIGFELTMSGDGGTFDGDAIPTAPPDVDAFTDPFLLISVDAGETAAQSSDFSRTAPEPSTNAFAAPGVVPLAKRWRAPI